MIKYHIKQQVKVLVYIALTSSMLYNSSEAVQNSITIIHVELPKYTQSDHYDEKLELACKNWVLSNDDIINIFNISNKYHSNSIILDDYYWLPCEIKGMLVYENEKWNFSINGAANALWNNGHSSIYFGCSKKECNSMFLLPYDGMSAE